MSDVQKNHLLSGYKGHKMNGKATRIAYSKPPGKTVQIIFWHDSPAKPMATCERPVETIAGQITGFNAFVKNS